ncbi:MAG: polyprenyl diphosphate synthase [Myxococcota bacterium]
MAADASSQLGPGQRPRHIAIIMDGNGRWAELHGRPRLEGHAHGAQSVRRIVTAAREQGIQALTLYAFSVQNWGRPRDEVDRLMTLLLDYLVEEQATIMKNGIRLRGIGQLERLPDSVLKQLRFLEELSSGNDDMILTLALSYGGKEEIVEVCRQLALDVAKGRLEPQDIDEASIDAYMFTKDLPPLDLLIRTSGEMRLSNFLLWQSAYAEIVVTEVLWPDFKEADFFNCLEIFRQRQRRFGLTSEQLAPDSD